MITAPLPGRPSPNIRFRLAARPSRVALLMAGVSGPVMAAACTPEAGDNRVTGWTQQITANCVFPRCVLQTSGITHNSVDVTLDVIHTSDFEGQYQVSPGTPKLVDIAVMGNDNTARTVVWGQRIGELDGTSETVLQGSRTFSGPEPNAHYVAVVYSPYLGYGNLNPFVLSCFRTAPAPVFQPPHATGCGS